MLKNSEWSIFFVLLLVLTLERKGIRFSCRSIPFWKGVWQMVCFEIQVVNPSGARIQIMKSLQPLLYGLPQEKVADIKLACGEAVMNAIGHGGDRVLQVRCVVHPSSITISLGAESHLRCRKDIKRGLDEGLSGYKPVNWQELSINSHHLGQGLVILNRLAKVSLQDEWLHMTFHIHREGRCSTVFLTRCSPDPSGPERFLKWHIALST